MHWLAYHSDFSSACLVPPQVPAGVLLRFQRPMAHFRPNIILARRRSIRRLVPLLYSPLLSGFLTSLARGTRISLSRYLSFPSLYVLLLLPPSSSIASLLVEVRFV